MGWRVAGTLLLAGGVLLAVGLVGGVFDDAERDGGPLAPTRAEGITGSGLRLDPGDVFSDRSAVLVNKSDQVAVLTSIRRLGTVGRLLRGRTYIALGTSADPDGAVTGAGEGFPPLFYSRGDLKDPDGFRVPPSRSKAGRFGAVVMTVGEVRSGEMFGMRGYEVRYQVGAMHYRTEIHQAVAACAAPRERCDPDDLLDRMRAAAAAARG